MPDIEEDLPGGQLGVDDDYIDDFEDDFEDHGDVSKQWHLLKKFQWNLLYLTFYCLNFRFYSKIPLPFPNSSYPDKTSVLFHKKCTQC